MEFGQIFSFTEQEMGVALTRRLFPDMIGFLKDNKLRPRDSKPNPL